MTNGDVSELIVRGGRGGHKDNVFFACAAKSRMNNKKCTPDNEQWVGEREKIFLSNYVFDKRKYRNRSTYSNVTYRTTWTTRWPIGWASSCIIIIIRSFSKKIIVRVWLIKKIKNTDLRSVKKSYFLNPVSFLNSIPLITLVEKPGVSVSWVRPNRTSRPDQTNTRCT